VIHLSCREGKKRAAISLTPFKRGLSAQKIKGGDHGKQAQESQSSASLKKRKSDHLPKPILFQEKKTSDRVSPEGSIPLPRKKNPKNLKKKTPRFLSKKRPRSADRKERLLPPGKREMCCRKGGCVWKKGEKRSEYTGKKGEVGIYLLEDLTDRQRG